MIQLRPDFAFTSDTPYLARDSPSRASYGVSFVRSLKKYDRDISRAHCIATASLGGFGCPVLSSKVTLPWCSVSHCTHIWLPLWSKTWKEDKILHINISIYANVYSSGFFDMCWKCEKCDPLLRTISMQTSLYESNRNNDWRNQLK